MVFLLYVIAALLAPRVMYHCAVVCRWFRNLTEIIVSTTDKTHGTLCQGSFMLQTVNSPDRSDGSMMATTDRTSSPLLMLTPCWLKLCDLLRIPPARNALPKTKRRFETMDPKRDSWTTRR